MVDVRNENLLPFFDLSVRNQKLFFAWKLDERIWITAMVDEIGRKVKRSSNPDHLGIADAKTIGLNGKMKVQQQFEIL